MNEFVNKAYNLLNVPYKERTVKGRCDAQRAIREALKYSMDEKDKEAMEYHLNNFEHDIFDIVSAENMRIQTEVRQAWIHIENAAKMLDSKNV